MFKFREYKFRFYNFYLLINIGLIGGIGMYLINRLQDEGEDLFKRQVLGYIVFTLMALFISMIDYHFIGKMFVPLYLVSLGLLLICKFSNSLPIYGWKHFTARRWIKIGGDPSAGINNPGFEFQPSEITKIIMIIFIARLFDVCRKYVKKLWVLIIAVVLMGIPIYLIFDQPDLSTSIVLLATFAAIVFASGVPYRIIVPIVLTAVPAIIGLFWYVQQDFQGLLDEYQQNRIFAMLYPSDYPELTYQQDNAAVAIRSGGMIGKLLSGDTGVRGSSYVPVKESDFIFTAVAEEFGFIGSCIVIILYAVLIFLIFRIAKRAKDYFGSLLAIGIGSLILFQVFINIGVVSSLLPNTGIPLPFMSSGLSSLMGSMIMIGILLNISVQPKDEISSRNKEESDFGYVKL